tara:strand:+ start:641 stop:1084 length:444 start_codon:yes stop_codon:yes gene_type:complete
MSFYFDKTSVGVVLFIIFLILLICVKNNRFTPESVSIDKDIIYPINEYDGQDYTKTKEDYTNWRPKRPRKPLRGPWNRPWRGNMYYPKRYPWYKSWMWENPYIYMNNPGCDGQACGGYCQPWNSKCCGGTKPFTCNSYSCKTNPLCN